MTPLTEPSPEAVPVKQTGEPRTADAEGANSSAFATVNPFLVDWLHAIASDGSLPSEALQATTVMARSVGIGRVAFTDWQRINAALGRDRRDLTVIETMSELALKGYLDRNIDERFGQNYGWTLLIPLSVNCNELDDKNPGSL
ncbi:hypothetical protein [Pseudarthrobacter sp. MDT1-22]